MPGTTSVNSSVITLPLVSFWPGLLVESSTQNQVFEDTKSCTTHKMAGRLKGIVQECTGTHSATGNIWTVLFTLRLGR